MTDKQIIIDGVDVSGCKYYLFREKQPKGERCCGMGLVDCNNNDCLYKKYKRKEQECEELKKWKKEHLKDVEFIERNPVIDILNSMADNILLEQRNEKLKQTFTEIKEIAERCGKRIPLFEIDEIAEDLKQILQKISEVENG